MALSSKLWFGGILSQAVHSLTHIYGVSTLCQMPSEGEEMLTSALQGLLVQGAERRTRVGNLSACMIRAHKASGCGVVYRVFTEWFMEQLLHAGVYTHCPSLLQQPKWVYYLPVSSTEPVNSSELCGHFRTASSDLRQNSFPGLLGIRACVLSPTAHMFCEDA